MNLERDRLHFDRWASRYDRSLLQPVLFSPTHAAVLRAAVEAGANPKVVLDLGCGTGRLLERAAKRWPDARFIGIDASPKMIAQAERKHSDGSRFRFEVADVASLPLDAASVDLALSTISFHHWDNQVTGLRQVASALRPGGLFVLADLQPPLLLRPLMPRFHARLSRKKMFKLGGFAVVMQRQPLRLGRHVLITVGRKA